MGNPKPYGGVPDIPDLDLPVPSAPSRPNVSAPAQPKKVPSLAPNALADLGGELGGEIERGMSAPPASQSSRRPGYPNVAIDMGPASGGAFSDDFGDMEIERGGGMSAPPSISSRSPAAGVHSAPPMSRGGGGRPSGSGLDVAYGRSDLQRQRHVAEGPSVLEKIIAVVLTLVISFGVAGALFKFMHRAGRTVIGLLPHAFDATSTIHSGILAGSFLVLAIAVGFIGVKAHPRSYAMIGSGATFLIASLAMVTVTLVSTEQNPMPPDGALLIPFAVPAALALLGLGVAWRGVPLFLRGGARRALLLLVAIIGGALMFGALEFSALATRIPPL